METVKDLGVGRSSIWKSAAAVVAGILFVGIVTTLIDQFWHMTNVYPPWGVPMLDAGLNVLALSYRILTGIGGGYITARLAPKSPMGHAILLGTIGTLFGILGAFGLSAMSPLWYPIAVVVIALPSAWLGGRLATRNR